MEPNRSKGPFAMTSIVKLSFALAIAATTLAALGGSAEAGPGYYARLRAPNYVAYDQFWKLKNPGGPVELNPQPLPPRYLSSFGLSNPGAKVGFNPQPDPPGDAGFGIAQ